MSINYTSSSLVTVNAAFLGFALIYLPPWWLSSKGSTCNAGAVGDMGSIPVSGRSPWRRAWQPTPVFLSGESHGQRSLAGYSPWGRKVWHQWSNLVCTRDCTLLCNSVMCSLKVDLKIKTLQVKIFSQFQLRVWQQGNGSELWSHVPDRIRCEKVQEQRGKRRDGSGVLRADPGGLREAA